ncbi:hypothetical protein NC653_007004 [Populus alba x Populus x berolinensis]|uniref:Uncharacterized protein n=2 Tax=Populus TaxID=3689 RepID=A0A4U5LT18_POPAL|nr:hypothetical protein NC653_007004 [Populus alba x Populus x berolinensis]TKR59214.1 hypothetical protein D5086_0000325610 [Populus alba]
MELNGRVIGLGIELLIESNYKVWRTCLESYLIGEDLWEVVSGDDTAAPENVDSLDQWTQNNTKEDFVLKRSISHALFEHVLRCKSASEIWQRLYNKKAASVRS